MTGPQAPTPSSSPERAALSRELGEFLIEFSIALHKHSMYPQGHPSLQPAAAGVLRRLVQLLRERPTLSLGVARHQLIIEGVATDSKHPVLSELAGRLHRHHLGAVSFSRGIQGGELEEALRRLAVEPGRGTEPIGLGPRDLMPRWDHVKLHAMSYDRLELMDEDGQPVASKAERAKSAQLWIGLARAALAGDLADDTASDLKPTVVAQAIDQHGRGEAYDQVIVGYMLQIAEELKSAGGREAVELRRRTSRLIAELRPETLQRLVEMGGDLGQRHKFVRDANHGMAVDAVLEIVRAAGSASNKTMSHSLIRMLSKMAAHADQGSTEARPLADAALREQVEHLLEGWELEDPNPGAYGTALQQMSRAAPVFATAAESMFGAEDERMVEMALELDIVGPTVWRAVHRMVSGDGLSRLLELLAGAPDGARAATEIRDQTFTAEAVTRLLAEPQPDFALLDRLLPVVGVAAAGPLLDALATADVRAVRRALLDRLGKLGAAIVPALLPRLSDSRWYVVRNLLALLDDLPELPAGFSPATFRGHADPRVRRQALKLELRHPAEREQALLVALSDRDQQTLNLALMAAQTACPPSAVPLLLARARDEALPGEYRVLAIKALGRSRAPEALLVLVDLTDGGRTLLGRAKLRPKSPEFLAALAALAAGWGTDDRATSVLARAAQSADADVRAATDPGLGTA
ncbi:MAG TPA: hypothetical protein VNX15_00670 [Gemmatimonadales bacterium]|nr:hypothetical protein [Gemmatimonadales bacterium]